MPVFDGSDFMTRHFRRGPKSLRKALIVPAVLLLISLAHSVGFWNVNAAVSSSSAVIESHFGHQDGFRVENITGFANHRIPRGANCHDLQVKSSIAATQSFHIEEDILDIAADADHPLIDYAGQKKGQSFSAMVAKTWGQMAGSSVWLEKYQVYLTVTRVFFYDKGVKKWPVISFIRAQLHDVTWHRLTNYTLTWHGENITFPRMLEVDIPYEMGGGFFGPEDPRVIIEPGIEDAEPIVFFNMLTNLTDRRRSMLAFHIFSNFTTRFQIEDYDAPAAEKNWAPFYPARPAVEVSAYQYVHHAQPQFPSLYMHFVYNLSPLKILRCHLMNGFCKFIFEQPKPAAYFDLHKHNATGGAMRGGTNFERLPAALQTRPGLTSYIGVTRTHTDDGCGEEDFYRPELMVLTTNGTSYYLDYVSEAITVFDDLFLTKSELSDPCREGRIFMANSIARIHEDSYGRNKDVMVLSWSVGDATVQIGNVRGIQGLIAGLPQWQTPPKLSRILDVQRAINVTSDVLDCSVRTSSDYAISVTPVEVEEAWQQKLKADEEKKKKEEEEKKKTET